MGSSTPVRIRTSSLPSSKGQGQLSQGQRRVELAQHGPLISSSIVPMAPTGNINTDHSCSRPGTQTWFSAAAWAQRTLWLWVAAQATQISTAPEAWPSDTSMAPVGTVVGVSLPPSFYRSLGGVQQAPGAYRRFSYTTHLDFSHCAEIEGSRVQ